MILRFTVPEMYIENWIILWHPPIFILFLIDDFLDIPKLQCNCEQIIIAILEESVHIIDG